MGRFVQQVSNEDPERIKRVLDAKYRTIGVDKDTLDKQVEEKKEREAAEKARDEWVTFKDTLSTDYWRRYRMSNAPLFFTCAQGFRSNV